MVPVRKRISSFIATFVANSISFAKGFWHAPKAYAPCTQERLRLRNEEAQKPPPEPRTDEQMLGEAAAR